MYLYVFGYAEQDAVIHYALSQVLLGKIFSPYFSEILDFRALAAPLKENLMSKNYMITNCNGKTPGVGVYPDFRVFGTP